MQGKELTTALHKEDDFFGYTSFIQNIAYEETATAIGNYLKEYVKEVIAFNVVKGFLNVVFSDSYFLNFFPI